MDKIMEFIKKRPKVVAAYGYGSGVFKQNGYDNNEKSQIDLILVVDDLKKWHRENMKMNPKDYSFTGKNFFRFAFDNELKTNTGVTYQSNIVEDNNIFKYGTIEYSDLMNYLGSWCSFYMPGRFQKTIKPIIENESLTTRIINNRYYALMTAAYMQDKDIVTKKELLASVISLSYLGDTRMAFAENPRKVLNILEGSYDIFEEMYLIDNEFIIDQGNGNLLIDKVYIKKHLHELPYYLYEYIMKYKDAPEQDIINKIGEFFTKINKRESIEQTLKGIKTNGITRSVSYASKKLVKRFKK